jgi:threonine dehydrogenase-like Zn-dependent dehydrogenase
MKAAFLHGPGDVRFEERDAPRIMAPSDAIVRISATCVCGSDLWPYRGANEVTQPIPMGHEYCGIVEEVGQGVTTLRPGQFVIGSFFASDNTIKPRASTESWSAERRRPCCGSRSQTARW